jgi:hypothetical protein
MLASGRRKRLLAMTAIALLTLLPVGAVSAAEAHVAVGAASCKQWNVSGAWATSQSNNFHVAFHFTQTRTTLGGTATLNPYEQAAAQYTTPSTRVTGTLKGSHLVVKISWRRTSGQVSTGRYTGTVSKGAVRGSDLDITTPGAATVSWAGRGPTRCVIGG